MSQNNRITIFDTTLRDGEQSPGATMTLPEKITMAQQLEMLGVDIIEAGFAASSQGDFDAISTIAKEVDSICVASLCRTNHADIDRAAEALRHAKHSRIHVFLATSPLHMEYKLKKTPDQILRMIEDGVQYAKSCTDNIEFSCEDGSRSEIGFLVEAVNIAIGAGARTINIPDTVGYAQPEEYATLIKTLREKVRQDIPVTFSVHCHNDLGMAVANSLAAVHFGGARQIEGTVGGIGERAGNTPIEEFVMALNVRQDYYGLTTGIKSQQIYPTVRKLHRIIGQPIARNKPLVGANAFAHESGIHQAGVMNNPLTYEIMTPESVGLTTSSLVLGKHSGRNAIAAKVEHFGYTLDQGQIAIIVDSVKKLADKKEEVYDEDLEAIIQEEVFRIPDKYKLIHLNIVSSDIGVPPTAMLVLDINGKRHEYAGFGVGSVDAVFKTIAHMTGQSPKLEQYFVNSITGGTDAQGEVTVKLTDGKFSSVGRGSDPDVINASARAYLNALNRLAKKQEEA